jgi:hypothetical protein
MGSTSKAIGSDLNVIRSTPDVVGSAPKGSGGIANTTKKQHKCHPLCGRVGWGWARLGRAVPGSILLGRAELGWAGLWWGAVGRAEQPKHLTQKQQATTHKNNKQPKHLTKPTTAKHNIQTQTNNTHTNTTQKHNQTNKQHTSNQRDTTHNNKHKQPNTNKP